MSRKGKMKKTVAVSLSAAMLLGAVPASMVHGEETSKWSETETADGWIMVTNEGGDTLGYSPDSGVTIIEQDGYAFKDLDKDGELDVYEDWRQEDDARIQDLVSKLGIEDMAGLMLFPGVFNNELAFDYIDQGMRSMLSFDTTSPAADQAATSNSWQAHAEATTFGIPVQIATNPRTNNIWPSSLASAATFDTELARQIANGLAKQYRAIGITLLLGPQIDLASDPRWRRVEETYGEDPALSRDMANAVISGTQSTYAEDGTDLGWGSESVIAMMKHWPGDGPGEGGRESHRAEGKYTVYPGGAFETQLIPFVDGGLTLDSATGSVAAVMPSYSIAWSEDEEYGELVGSAFSEYKIQLLRSYGFEGYICTDFEVTSDTQTHWGVDDLTVAERTYKAISAGVDQLGGDSDPAPVLEAYDMAVEELGEEAALARFQESAARLLKDPFRLGMFENPYVDTAAATELLEGEDITAEGYAAQLQSIVMLKNEGNVIKAAEESEEGELPTVYIPLQYTAGTTSTSPDGTTTISGGSWDLPVDLKTANQYFNVITDTVSSTLTGPEDADGNPTASEDDVVRATAEELAECDYALVIVENPKNYGEGGNTSMGQGYDYETDTYIPISLQYGEYTATSQDVRDPSLAGDTEEVAVENPYGQQTATSQENRSYYGQSAKIVNSSALDSILYASENVPEEASVIVAVNATNPMVFSEFESEVDAILMGFGINNELFFDIVTGAVEPSGLLPLQMPASMEAVEAQLEDVPRDMECYVDSAGNTYDFAFGLNWSGVISDERTETYAVEPLTTPEAVPAAETAETTEADVEETTEAAAE